MILVIQMNDLNKMVITQIQPPVVVNLEKGRKVQMKNRRSFGLSLCISGQITYTMNGKAYISNQSNAVILPQGGTYSLLCDREGLFPVLNFTCENFHCDEIVILPLKNAQACMQNFETIKNMFFYNESSFKVYSVFYELLGNVFSANTPKSTPLDCVIQYIAENIQNPELSNTCLARQIGISEVYLRKLFLAHYNITPRQHILDIRIRKAKQLLCDTPLTVATIAEKCGFSSVYHFCRMFKQRTGLTPTQYAANNKVYKI